MVAHCVKMLARDLGEPLIGHRQDTQSGSMGTHRRSKKRHRSSNAAHWSWKADPGRLSTLFQHQMGDTGTRRTHIAPRTSLIANRTVVFATHSFLSFDKKPRMSS